MIRYSRMIDARVCLRKKYPRSEGCLGCRRCSSNRVTLTDSDLTTRMLGDCTEKRVGGCDRGGGGGDG